MNSIERLLQLCFNKIQTWADENGFQFSKTKAVCMRFYQQHIFHPDPENRLSPHTCHGMQISWFDLRLRQKIEFRLSFQIPQGKMHESNEPAEGS